MEIQTTSQALENLFNRVNALGDKAIRRKNGVICIFIKDYQHRVEILDRLLKMDEPHNVSRRMVNGRYVIQFWDHETHNYFEGAI